MRNYLAEYFCCPENYVRISQDGELGIRTGYFRFGPQVCYGQAAGLEVSDTPDVGLSDALPATKTGAGTTCLPFDLAQIVDNLRYERYAKGAVFHSPLASTAASVYYYVRPLLAASVRRRVQRAGLRYWKKLSFPHWPVDLTVDSLFEQLMLMALRSQGLSRIPFIWFWPDGASSCAIMTHDVETAAGRDASSTLMDINDRFGIKSSFQVIPEYRYSVPNSYLDEIRARGFEINVHDLDHDGRLYQQRRQFLARAAKINAYGQKWGAHGFRAGVLYRRQDWFDSFEFDYEMSVPNVAHLDPQRGGCCTVMPYFIGKVLELPVTMTQDYTLFNILNDHSIDLWKQQIDLVMSKNGMMNCIVHPDYITRPRESQTYETLLQYLAALRRDKGVWISLPGEVNQWWRQRNAMTLVEDERGWRITGEGSEKARLAYASDDNGELSYSFAPHKSQMHASH
jgi:hypothetical protein